MVDFESNSRFPFQPKIVKIEVSGELSIDWPVKSESTQLRNPQNLPLVAKVGTCFHNRVKGRVERNTTNYRLHSCLSSATAWDEQVIEKGGVL